MNGRRPRNFPANSISRPARPGSLGIGYPEAYGGSCEGDLFAKVAASEELMRCGSGGLVAGLGSLDIGLPPVVKRARPEVRERVVPAVLRGEKIMALAVTEPSGGSDVANLKTRAVRDGDHYRVSGSKTFITSGVRADYYTVAVRTGGEGFAGISLLLVEKGTAGFSVGRKLKKMGWWASDTAELFFDDCRVPAENPHRRGECRLRLHHGQFPERAPGPGGDGQHDRATGSGGVAALGARARSVRQADRQVPGAAPSSRGNGHATGGFREFTYRQAAKMAAGKSVIKEISMAKNFATDVADRLTYDAVQVLGGMGYMRESLVERLYRDNRILSIGGGSREIMNEIIGKQMGL